MFPQLQPMLKPHQVVEVLRQAIVRGELRPGERIVESRIAREFGVSQTPVREALAMLVREGLVVKHSHRGSFVAELSREDLKEICTVRALLEGYCARLAAGEPERLADLDVYVDEMRAAAARGDFAALMETDLAFHRALHVVAGHRLLADVLRSLQQRMRLTVAFADAYSEPEVVAESHATLISAIRTGDGDAAERAGREHVLELLDLMDGPSGGGAATEAGRDTSGGERRRRETGASTEEIPSAAAGRAGNVGETKEGGQDG